MAPLEYTAVIEGLSKRDSIRCLKRYIAREVFQALKTDLNTHLHP